MEDTWPAVVVTVRGSERLIHGAKRPTLQVSAIPLSVCWVGRLHGQTGAEERRQPLLGGPMGAGPHWSGFRRRHIDSRPGSLIARTFRGKLDRRGEQTLKCRQAAISVLVCGRDRLVGPDRDRPTETRSASCTGGRRRSSDAARRRGVQLREGSGWVYFRQVLRRTSRRRLDTAQLPA